MAFRLRRIADSGGITDGTDTDRGAQISDTTPPQAKALGTPLFASRAAFLRKIFRRSVPVRLCLCRSVIGLYGFTFSVAIFCAIAGFDMLSVEKSDPLHLVESANKFDAPALCLGLIVAAAAERADDQQLRCANRPLRDRHRYRRARGSPIDFPRSSRQPRFRRAG